MFNNRITYCALTFVGLSFAAVDGRVGRGAISVDNVIVVVIVRHQNLIIRLKGNVDHRLTTVAGGHLPLLQLLQFLTASQTSSQKLLFVLLPVDLIGVLAQFLTVDAITEGHLLLLLLKLNLIAMF